ncbi:hypothetical protein DUPY_24170 [Duganella phyllosphaerae]|uniref:Uncharacterized protein n=1 Tax=Duganella phyllosphaerae TaxID=762836 RepID=A0A1E7WMT4_9BURK|nr:hypothetical protein DUPY_24170 [Duganella phyllosphaerae]
MAALAPATPALGVNSAVYTSGSALATRFDSTPLETLMASRSKPTGASLKVKVITAVSPALSWVLLLVIVKPGACASTEMAGRAPPRPALPAASL